MSSSIFQSRAQTFAENLGDNAVKTQIEQCLLLSNYPGPIVSFVGAEGRGKTSLFSKTSHAELSGSERVNFAGVESWQKPTREMAREMELPNSLFKLASSEDIGEVLLCDMPAFGSVENDKFISSFLGISDLAIMAVQITQPAGGDEVAFARKHLANIPSVLVLTKCDQADDEDFQEGLDAVLDNYGDLPWLAVLLSDASGELTESETRKGREGEKVLLSFQQWWAAEGCLRAEELHHIHLNQLQQNWLQKSKMFLDDKEQKNAPQLELVTKSIRSSSSAKEALQLQDDLMNGLKALPDMALYHYKFFMTDLHRNINQLTYQFTDKIKAGKDISQAEIEQALSSAYREWDQEARLNVLDKIKPTLDGLQKKAVRYAELTAIAVHKSGGQEIIQGNSGGAMMPPRNLERENVVTIEGDFDLTITDKLRTAAIPTVSGLGAGVLLLTVVGATFLAPFAPIIALAGGGIMGVGTLGSVSESSHLRRASKLREAIQRQTGDYDRQLEQQLYSHWKEKSEDVRDSVATSKRQLNILMMQQSTSQDQSDAKENDRLISNMRKIATLRLELKWLEEHKQSAKLFSDKDE